MQKAFESTVEASEKNDNFDLIQLTKDLLFHQKQKDSEQKIQQLESQHIKDIADMNTYLGDGDTLKKKREQVLELDLEFEDFTENDSFDNDDSENTLDDADVDSFSELEDEVNRQ